MRNLCTIAAMVVASALPGPSHAQAPSVKLILDNASVRVELATIEPGSGTGVHSIVTPESGIVLEGEVTLDSPNGRQTLRAGEAFWVPGLTPHDLRNNGRVQAKVYGTFLKRCD